MWQWRIGDKTKDYLVPLKRCGFREISPGFGYATFQPPVLFRGIFYLCYEKYFADYRN